MTCALLRANRILINYLKNIVMNILLINQCNILRHAIITCQNLNIILLNFTRLLNNLFIFICYAFCKKALPF